MIRTSNFLPYRLKELAERSNASYPQISKGADIGESTLNFIINKHYDPSINMVVNLADFFGISIDYFFDRVDDKTAEQMLENQHVKFEERRRIAYEMYINCGRRKTIFHDELKEAPWPYNLIEAIKMEECEEVYSQEIINSIEERLLSSNVIAKERTKRMLLLYFKDGKTLDQIGNIYSTTRETVRQILKKGLRLLRKPAFANYIVRDDEKIKLEIENLTREKESLEHSISELRRIKETYVQAINEVSGQLDEKKCIAYTITPTSKLDELNLSVRAYNCLWRKGCKTLADVIKLAEGDGGLRMVRNIGINTEKEILTLIKNETGIEIKREVC